eukprot:2132510-Pleurochrysis_carterae.AAC.1
MHSLFFGPHVPNVAKFLPAATQVALSDFALSDSSSSFFAVSAPLAPSAKRAQSARSISSTEPSHVKRAQSCDAV